MRKMIFLPLAVFAAVAAPASSKAQNPVEEEAPPTATSWWRSFGDAQLAELVDRALASGLTVDIAAARLEQALAAARTTRASLLPSVGFGATAGAIRQSLEDPVIRPFSRFPGFQRDVERYDARLNAAWEIDLFGAKPRLRSARASAAAALADTEAARVSLAADTAIGYLNLRELQRRVEIARLRAASLDRQRTAIRLRVAAGTVARLDLDRLEGEVEAANASVPVLQALLAGEEARLGVLVADRELVRRIAATPPPADPISAIPSELEQVQVTLERRPDVVAAERRLAAFGANVAVAKSARWPRLSLSGLIATIATAPASLFTGAATALQGQGGVTGTLFDFGRIDAAIAEAKGAQREALAAYRLTLLRAQAEVDTAAAEFARRREEAADRLCKPSRA
jgi:NodT family efflux transporter outer membrane factor (OMF) lipoprotein